MLRIVLALVTVAVIGVYVNQTPTKCHAQACLANAEVVQLGVEEFYKDGVDEAINLMVNRGFAFVDASDIVMSLITSDRDMTASEVSLKYLKNCMNRNKR
jgi:hypothetical protein